MEGLIVDKNSTDEKLDKLLTMLEEERKRKHQDEINEYYRKRNEKPSCGLT